MKTIFTLLILLCFVQDLQAQDNSQYRIISSSTGSSGSSKNVVTAKGTYKVSQSVGQASVIGTHSNKGYVLRQGFQQPSHKIKRLKEPDYNLEAKVYPNPFDQAITISFNNTLINDISVSIVDVNGKLIDSQIFSPTKKIELKVKAISEGIYFLKVVSGKKHFNTKLIKL